MEYLSKFQELHIEDNPEYLLNDIGIAKLFYDLHSEEICYVVEAKAWFVYSGKRWAKDEEGLGVMERCKGFAQALAAYAHNRDDGSEGSVAFTKYAVSFHTRRKREGLLSDARSIAPNRLTVFDRDRLLFNCQNGTLSLTDFNLRPHSAGDRITKLSRVRYDGSASCERWERFVLEIMCGDKETAKFLQKAFGYCLSGDTSLECFFILYGATTRNGKSTLTETVAYILGDYARTIQPQTLSRRSSDGAAASPDTARLKGARMVVMPEPEKGLELNVALVKQLTGGDTYTARSLHENPVEFAPEFKIFINTNHLPGASEDTLFASGRVKLIPFERHFEEQEQDTGLKMFFRKPESMSGILNWLLEGYFLLQDEGLNLPEKVKAAIAEYRQEADIIGNFADTYLNPHEEGRIVVKELYGYYREWAKASGYRPLKYNDFCETLRLRFFVKKDRNGLSLHDYILK